MNILFLGDASNYHYTLAQALRRFGHHTCVVSAGSGWMNTDRNIDIRREKSVIGTIKYGAKLLRILPRLKRYDIVYLSNPVFLELRPEKLIPIFDYLKRNNDKIIYSALGTDYNYVDKCLNTKIFKYSDYRIGDSLTEFAKSKWNNEKLWLADSMKATTFHIIENVDGIMSCLYEYNRVYEDISPDKLGYGGIPIDLDSIAPHFIENEPEKVRFFIGIQRNRSVLKGTDIILEALKAVQHKYPDKCEIEMVENVPYKEYVERMISSHVLLDQLYSYTPATNALIGLARGLAVVSGAEPEYYDFIGERENRPIVNVSPLIKDDIENKLEQVIKNKHQLSDLSHRGREFVEKHNDSNVVAKRHIDFWNKI